jgi:hypothetical protein
MAHEKNPSHQLVLSLASAQGVRAVTKSSRGPHSLLYPPLSRMQSCLHDICLQVLVCCGCECGFDSQRLRQEGADPLCLQWPTKFSKAPVILPHSLPPPNTSKSQSGFCA